MVLAVLRLTSALTALPSLKKRIEACPRLRGFAVARFLKDFALATGRAGRADGRLGRLTTKCLRSLILRNAAFRPPSTDFERARTVVGFVVVVFVRGFARMNFGSFLVPPTMSLGFDDFILRAVFATCFLVRSIACLPGRDACDAFILIAPTVRRAAPLPVSTALLIRCRCRLLVAPPDRPVFVRFATGSLLRTKRGGVYLRTWLCLLNSVGDDWGFAGRYVMR